MQQFSQLTDKKLDIKDTRMWANTNVMAGVPQTNETISTACRLKFTILRGHVEILLFDNFFPIVDTCLNCEDIARQSCATVPRQRIFVDFWVLHFQRASCSNFRPAF